MSKNDKKENPPASPTKESPSPSISTELTRDALLNYVELDLWSRFQKRLWAVVGVFLTVITVFGYLGVPYYINNEVTKHLIDRENEFAERTKEITEYSKLLAVLRAQYDSERYRFDGDVLRLVEGLRASSVKVSSNAVGVSYDQQPLAGLLALISTDDFTDVIAGSSLDAFKLQDEPKEAKILPPTVRGVSGRGAVLITNDTEAHPIRNGTYEGCLTDLKFRIVALEAMRRTIQKIEGGMLAIGTNINRSTTSGTITMDTLKSKDFTESFAAEFSSIAKGFLSNTEQSRLAQWQRLYTLGYQINYKPTASPAPTPQN